MRVPFSPPSITEREIEAVSAVLRSGWITTGPKTAEFERALAAYCSVEEVFCLNSATAGLSLVLEWYGVGPGDEVITSPYTFAATANVILHRGATPVFVDICEEDFNLNPDLVAAKITKHTKAVIAVDFGGWPCDYEKLKEVIQQKQAVFEATPKTNQEKLGRILLVADAAHSFGAEYRGQKAGSFGDFDVFSFHAVKNLTTAEGGAVAFNSLNEIGSGEIRQHFKLMGLHGQSKSALEKQQLAGWFYEIQMAGYKYNLTDMAAAMGLVQLER
ncbi:MAG: capsular biosynthesis protein, partial [Spirochaetae bacterium HGW-Spirochaetae-6]